MRMGGLTSADGANTRFDARYWLSRRSKARVEPGCGQSSSVVPPQPPYKRRVVAVIQCREPKSLTSRVLISVVAKASQK